MKLRNKKTGEIGLLQYNSYDGGVFIQDINAKNNWECIAEYRSLAELNEDWEDYEEPKEFWNIDEEGIIRSTKEENWPEESVVAAKSIGNYFETKEEAEKAMEKLKAWKRLKDKGFVWQGWEEGAMDNGMCVIGCQIPENNWETDVVEDLDLLFGGEE